MLSHQDYLTTLKVCILWFVTPNYATSILILSKWPESVGCENFHFHLDEYQLDRYSHYAIITFCPLFHHALTHEAETNGRHFPDDIFKCIFLNENVWIAMKISLKFVLKGPINNNPALVQIMAWRRPGDKPLSEPRMESLLAHICVTRPQWVNPRHAEFILANIKCKKRVSPVC